MDLIGALHLDELSHGLANLSMFPYFEMAHYIVSVMALREQPGALEVSRVSPLACWFSSMLYCFGGAVLSGIMLAEPPVAPLSNSTSVLLASIIWYLVFYAPWDLVYCCAAPAASQRWVLSGHEEVTRTWRSWEGSPRHTANTRDSLLVMIAIGGLLGAGRWSISSLSSWLRGVWRPETNELLKMSSNPTKITLIGAVLFALQQTHYLPVQKQHLMLIYTVFTVVNKSRMMLTGSSTSPFATIESAVYKTLFTGSSPYAALTAEVKKSCINSGATNGTASTSATKESSEKGSTGQHSPVNGQSSSLETKEESENAATTNCKKTN
ncbi:LOW QUALITY PROTEIN: trimeric intracellular cation channel type B [Acanthochromis polyacanthus]|uniref:LOW QUALITY PROTEIN: trimeric intracellular cation channel type B n=1 Tax=Acanthochromis polyacanthus TaxID=80966 RepID=UPI0022347CAC|nr:LOW QUALITY PROTEIN: trimeric intracellular cation channel type B [Acanthochromis polyacanthus]